MIINDEFRRDFPGNFSKAKLRFGHLLSKHVFVPIVVRDPDVVWNKLLEGEEGEEWMRWQFEMTPFFSLEEARFEWKVKWVQLGSDAQNLVHCDRLSTDFFSITLTFVVLMD